MADSSTAYTEPASMSTDPFSPCNAERTTTPEVDTIGSETTTVMSTQTQSSAPTAIIVSTVIIIIVILAIIVVVILIVVFRRSLRKWLLSLKSQHQSDWSRSNQHSEENNRNLSNDISGQTYDVLNRSPKTKSVAANRTQDSSNSSEMYSILDKGVKNSEGGTTYSRNVSDMYAVVDERQKDSIAIYEAPDNPSESAVGEKAKQKASNMSEAPDKKLIGSETYAVVDKSAKKKTKIQNEDSNIPNISEMYAVVDKTAKRNAKGLTESLNSPNISEMYAVVDKKGKSNITLNQDISEM